MEMLKKMDMPMVLTMCGLYKADSGMRPPAQSASQRVRSAADAPVGRLIFDCLSSSATWTADAAFLKSVSVSLPLSKRLTWPIRPTGQRSSAARPR